MVFESLILNDGYENFVTTLKGAVAECIPSKPIAKFRVSWESIAVKKEQDNMKKVSLLNKRNSSNTNAQKLKKVLREIKRTKRTTKYIQDQINKIRNSVEGNQFQLV